MRRVTETKNCFLALVRLRPRGELAIAMLWTALITTGLLSTANADVFVLQTGGRIEGKLLNPDQNPRTAYEVQVDDGGQITLEADQVAEVVTVSEAESQYQALLPKMPPTADGNWKMAVWCRHKNLESHTDFHLEEVIRLDPEHERARRALGYSRLEGQWIKREDYMRDRGYVLHEGKWRLPQAVEIETKSEQEQLAVKQWLKQLRKWRSKLGTQRGREATQKLLNVQDPLAAPALAELLVKEADPRVQELYLKALGDLNATASTQAFILGALQSPHPEIRELSLDYLEQRESQRAVTAFTAALSSSDNALVRRAAAGLGRLKDPNSVRPLIKALITRHRIKIASGNPGQLGTGFGAGSGGSGGISFGSGGGPKYIDQPVKNREALEALQAITGVDFQYNPQQWLAWYIDQKTPDLVSLRRSE